MTAQRSEPIFIVKVKHSATKAGTGGSTSGNPALAKAAHDLALAKEEVAIYANNVAAGGDPGADEKLAGAKARQKEREADLEAARKAGGPAVPAKASPPPAEAPKDDLEDISLHFTSFEYQDEEKKTDLLKLTLDNKDLRYFDEPLVQKGTQLVVSWGYPGAMCPERLVIVQKLSGFAQLTVEAQDKGVLAQKVTRSRVFENVARSAVVRSVGRELGYTDDQMEIEETAVLPVVTQAAQTDGQFIKKLADLEGFEYFIDFNGLHWHPRRTGQKPIRKLVYYLDPGVGDILSLNLDSDVLGVPGAVTQAGRDPLAKTDIKATANADNTKRDTTGAQQDVGAPPAPVTYTQKVDPATGQTTTTVSKPPVTKPDGVSSSTTAPTAASTSADAQKQAGGSFTSKQQTAIKLSGELVGDPFLGAKTIVEIAGIGKRLSGRYYLATVTHKIDSGGYKTSFKAHSDGTGLGSGGQGKASTPNKKDAPDTAGASDTDPVPLQQVQKVDPATGKTVTEYRNAQGKAPADPPAKK